MGHLMGHRLIAASFRNEGAFCRVIEIVGLKTPMQEDEQCENKEDRNESERPNERAGKADGNLDIEVGLVGVANRLFVVILRAGRRKRRRRKRR